MKTYSKFINQALSEAAPTNYSTSGKSGTSSSEYGGTMMGLHTQFHGSKPTIGKYGIQNLYSFYAEKKAIDRNKEYREYIEAIYGKNSLSYQETLDDADNTFNTSSSPFSDPVFHHDRGHNDPEGDGNDGDGDSRSVDYHDPWQNEGPDKDYGQGGHDDIGGGWDEYYEWLKCASDPNCDQGPHLQLIGELPCPPYCDNDDITPCLRPPCYDRPDPPDPPDCIWGVSHDGDCVEPPDPDINPCEPWPECAEPDLDLNPCEPWPSCAEDVYDDTSFHACEPWPSCAEPDPDINPCEPWPSCAEPDPEINPCEPWPSCAEDDDDADIHACEPWPACAGSDTPIWDRTDGPSGGDLMHCVNPPCDYNDLPIMVQQWDVVGKTGGYATMQPINYSDFLKNINDSVDNTIIRGWEKESTEVINEAEPIRWSELDKSEREDFAKEAGLPKTIARDTWKKLNSKAKTKLSQLIKKTTDGEFELIEKLTPAQAEKKEEIVLSMKKKKKEFQERYGDEWESVMHATATKIAKNESLSEAIVRGDRNAGMPTGADRGSEEKPLMKWLTELERELKKIRSSYDEADADVAIWLYQEGKNPKETAKVLASRKEPVGFSKESVNEWGTSYDQDAYYAANKKKWEKDADAKTRQQHKDVNTRTKALKKVKKSGWDGLSKKEREVILDGAYLLRADASKKWGKLNPRVRMSLTKNYGIKESVDATRYTRVHGKAPRGTGLWMFTIHPGGVDFDKHKEGKDYVKVNDSYAVAAKKAEKMLKSKKLFVTESVEHGESSLYETRMLGRQVSKKGDYAVIGKNNIILFIGNKKEVDKEFKTTFNKGVGWFGGARIAEIPSGTKVGRKLKESSLYETRMLGKQVIVQGKSGVATKYLGNEHGAEMYEVELEDGTVVKSPATEMETAGISEEFDVKAFIEKIKKTFKMRDFDKSERKRAKRLKKAARHYSKNILGLHASFDPLSEAKKDAWLQITDIYHNHSAEKVHGILVDAQTAQLLNKVYDSLKDRKNKKSFINAINKDRKGLQTMVDFSWKMIKKESVELGEKVDWGKMYGYIATYKGKELRIKKNEADGIFAAKRFARRHFKIHPADYNKLTVEPAMKESVELDEKFTIVGYDKKGKELSGGGHTALGMRDAESAAKSLVNNFGAVKVEIKERGKVVKTLSEARTKDAILVVFDSIEKLSQKHKSTIDNIIKDTKLDKEFVQGAIDFWLDDKKIKKMGSGSRTHYMIKEDAPAGNVGGVSGMTPDTVGVDKKKKKKKKKRFDPVLFDNTLRRDEEKADDFLDDDDLGESVSYSAEMVDTYKGHPVFRVSEAEFDNCNKKRDKGERWNKFFEGESETGSKVRRYSLRNPNKPLYVQNEKTGEIKKLRRRMNDQRLKHNKKKVLK